MGGRGSETTVQCDFCGRRVPHSRAYSQYKPMMGGFGGARRMGGRFGMPTTKYYYCFRCAKRKGILK